MAEREAPGIEVGRGEPTEEDVAAIVAAIEACWPRPAAAASDAAPEPDRWRFSGRWWAKPVPVRRDRPSHYLRAR